MGKMMLATTLATIAGAGLVTAYYDKGTMSDAQRRMFKDRIKKAGLISGLASTVLLVWP